MGIQKWRRPGRRCFTCGFSWFAEPAPADQSVAPDGPCPKCGAVDKLPILCGGHKSKCRMSTCEHNYATKLHECPDCGAPRCMYKWPTDPESADCPECGAIGSLWCTRSAERGAQRCMYHGGTIGKAPNLPGIGAYLPKKVRDRFLMQLDNPDLLSTREDIALFAARQTYLMERLRTGEFSQFWEKLYATSADLRAVFDEYQEADPVEAEKLGERRDKLTAKLLKVIADGADKEKTWRELLDLTKDAASLKVEETKRIKELQQIVTAEEFLRSMVYLEQAIRQYVKDESTLRNIANAFERVVDMKPGGVPRLEG